MVGDGTNDLTEKQLVEKANLAMGMMAEGECQRTLRVRATESWT